MNHKEISNPASSPNMTLFIKIGIHYTFYNESIYRQEQDC